MGRKGWLGLSGLAAAGLAAIAVFGAGAPAPAAAQPQGGACAALTTAGLFKDTTVQSAVMVAPDAAKGTPAFCEVTAVVSPAANSRIGVVYRLPEGWNGKLLGLGGGGWAGNIRIETALGGLRRGYATLQTDGGHPGVSPWENSWAANPEAASDFSWRAIHLMTVVGKDVAGRYYGRPQDKTYYQGCSTGGRQGLMEVQRFPDDYDAVIAGAPVYNLLVQTSAVVRDQVFGAPGAGLSPEQMMMVNESVLAACDAKDGLADGVLADPRMCGWDPVELQCKPGQAAASCLSDAQVGALRAAYRGTQTIDGRVAAWPLAKGGEVGWSMFIPTSGKTPDATGGGGMSSLGKIITGDPNFDMSKFDPSQDLPRIMSSSFAREYNADNPAIGAFIKRGGKLLMWHGWSDPGPSPVGTITYYEQVRGSAIGADKSVRLFLAPGVYHCGGGPGPDKMDLLGAIDAWVKTGQAPQTILATKADAKISRPLCAYPAVAHYKGSGDPDAASSFECRL
jgi:feruloyl esterase